MKKKSTITLIVVLLSLFLNFGNKLIPTALGLTPIGVSVLCIFVATILQMLFLDNISATFLSVLAFTQCGVWEFGQTLTNYFGTNLFWFMVASGLSTAFNHPEGNVKEFFGAVFGDAVSGLPDFVVILVLAILCTVMTGFASNIVSGTISSTIMYTLIRSGLVGVNPVAFCCVMAICACSGFATAPANAYSSVTAASGWTTPGNQLKTGLLMSLLIAVLASTVGYTLGLVIA